MRGPLRHVSRLGAALTLLVAIGVAGAARAFTPTQDSRSIHASGGFPTPTVTAVPFQPFSASVQIIESGIAIGGATQSSSILADGIVASGAAGVGASTPFPRFASSGLAVHFDLAQSAVFSLQVSLSTQFSPNILGFVLERTAPNPAVFVSLNGNSQYDESVSLPPGSYRLASSAQGSSADGGSGGGFSFDFQRTCASASSQDTDLDNFADDCDICPLDFDPGQGDTDKDGIGDACNDAVDFDGDDYANTLDNCPTDSNQDQLDVDGDGTGDVCDHPELITQILDPTQFDIFISPTHAALAPNGAVFVLIWNYQRIFKILPPAGPAFELYRPTLGAQVFDIAVGPDGYVYTAGGSVARCYRIHPVLGNPTALLINANGDGQGHVLTYANRVTVAPDGRAFVSGRDSQNVFEITAGGAKTQVIGPSGNGSVVLGQPQALDTDAAGNLYVLGISNYEPRVFRITPGHQIELWLHPDVFPNDSDGSDLVVGDDGSVYVAGDGILVRRPSGTVDELLPINHPYYARQIDVDSYGVVHAVGESNFAFRVTPTGQVGPLMNSSGDGQGHPLQQARDVVVTPGATKRIVVVGNSSHNAFSIVDQVAVAVPALGPSALGLLAVVLLASAAWARRR